MTSSHSVNELDFRQIMGLWTTGVSIITSQSETDRPVGIICNSLTSISIKQNHLLWTVDHSAGSFNYWKDATDWAVHFLADDQIGLVDCFRRRGVANKFSELDYYLSEFGNPVLPGAVARLECKTIDYHETYDHRIIIGEVVQMTSSDKSPLIFALSKFFSGTLSPLDH